MQRPAAVDRCINANCLRVYYVCYSYVYFYPYCLEEVKTATAVYNVCCCSIFVA